MNWREYHNQTKHSVESLRRSPHALDWDNMPDPFRHYEGVPLIDLPADPAPPDTLALDILNGSHGVTPACNGATFFSTLLFHSAAISASKRIPSGGKYALRVNPSSGNLHPTEFHFITRSLLDWPDGLYHYRPSSHMAEQRVRGHIEQPPGRFLVLLTTIAWREAWKYRSRAYRYCLHDTGHAWQALALAAQALGCGHRAIAHFADADLANAFHLHDDEWPMLLIEIDAPATANHTPTANHPLTPPLHLGGTPNRLSPEIAPYPLIDQIHAATILHRPAPPCPVALPPSSGSGEIALPPPAHHPRPFGEVVRNRRSALDFTGGHRAMPLPVLAAILDTATRPLNADFAGAPLVQLYLYAHRIEGLDPGVYRHWPETRELETIRTGDQRVAAAGLSLGQNLAGNACVAFSMIADLERAARTFGNRGYRYAHFEAGAIGHRMYIASEALGFRSTGIGAFFDDRVHEYLNLRPEDGQVVYHFAIGHPLPDPRLEA
jgi:SagB-type dehydrogenase family enzyme